MPDPGFPDPDAAPAFPPFFIVFFVIFGIVFVTSIVVAVVRAKRVVDAGHNPLTLQTDLELKVLDSAALAPGTAPAAAATGESVEVKLQKLNDLHAQKLISDDELAAARAKILAQ